jgi:hypothetical protein
LKKLLIISPHFAPVNAPDMHRVRQCLPYLRENGWEAVIFAVEPKYVEMSTDPLLLETLPEYVEVHRIGALPQRWTRLLGLGNLGIRCFWSLRRAVNRYLETNRVDLIFFSTTVFVTMALGPYWKKRFGVPFVLDLQDPWRNDYYLTRPRHERPSKFWFDYRLNHFLEKRTVPEAAGFVTVSPAYPKALRERYPAAPARPSRLIPFSVLPVDLAMTTRLDVKNRFFDPTDDLTHVVYTGVVPANMALSLSAVFGAVRMGLDLGLPGFARLRFYFIGTRYATSDSAMKTVEALAEQYGVRHLIVEQAAREPYFNALRLLREADLLLLLGTTDGDYTASKLYPYILSQTPLLSVFNERSSVVDILRRTRAGEILTFTSDEKPAAVSERLLPVLAQTLGRLPFAPDTDWAEFETYSARAMTGQLCGLFADVGVPSEVAS